MTSDKWLANILHHSTLLWNKRKIQASAHKRYLHTCTSKKLMPNHGHLLTAKICSETQKHIPWKRWRAESNTKHLESIGTDVEKLPEMPTSPVCVTLALFGLLQWALDGQIYYVRTSLCTAFFRSKSSRSVKRAKPPSLHQHKQHQYESLEEMDFAKQSVIASFSFVLNQKNERTMSKTAI